MGWSHLGGSVRIYGLDLAPGAGIWASGGDRGKAFWVENGRPIGFLGTIPKFPEDGPSGTVCPQEAVTHLILQMSQGEGLDLFS